MATDIEPESGGLHIEPDAEGRIASPQGDAFTQLEKAREHVASDNSAARQEHEHDAATRVPSKRDLIVALAVRNRERLQDAEMVQARIASGMGDPDADPRAEALADIREGKANLSDHLQIRDELEQSADRRWLDDGTPAEPEGNEARQRSVAAIQEAHRQVYGSVPFVLPDGQIARVTPDQARQMSVLAAEALAMRQQAAVQQQRAAQNTQLAEAQRQAAAVRQGMPPVLPRADAEAFLRQYSYGSPEEQIAAVQQLAEGLVARTRQEAPIVVAQHVQQQQRQAYFVAAVNQVGTEFPEIFNDLSLSQLAALKVGEARQQAAQRGEQIDDLTAFRRGCTMAAQTAGIRPGQSRTNAKAQSNPDWLAERAMRKVNAPSQPVSVGRVYRDADPSDRMTRHDVVNQMRKQRGQV